MKYFIIKLFYVTLLIVPGLGACKSDILLAPEEQSWLEERNNTVRFIRGINAPPMAFENENGEYDGIVVDYLRVFLKKFDIKLDLVKAEKWADVSGMLKNSKIDFLAMENSPDREKDFIFTPAFIEFPYIMATRKSYPGPSSLNELSGKTITVVKGYLFEEFLRKNHPDISIETVINDATGIEKLAAGEIEIFASNLAYISTLIDKKQIQNVKIIGKTGFVNKFSFAVRKEDVPLARIFEKGLAAMSGEEKGKIIDKWIIPEVKKTPLWQKPAIALIALFIIVLLVLVVYRVLQKPAFFLFKNLFSRYRWKLLIVGALLVSPAVIITLFYSSGPPPSSLNEEEKEWLKKQNYELKINYIPSPPLNFINSDGQYSGMLDDYLSIMKKRLGFEMVVVPFHGNWFDHISNVEKGEVHFTVMGPTPERRKKFLFTSSFISFPFVIVVRKSDKRFYTLEDLKGKRVAVPRGWIIEDYLRKYYPQISLVTVQKDLLGLFALSGGEVDTYIGNLAYISYRIEKEKIANLRIAGETGVVSEMAFATSKNNIIVRNILQKGQNAVSKKELDEIYNRWVRIGMPSRIFSKKTLYGILIAVTFIFIVALVVFIWNRTLRKQVMIKTGELQQELVERKKIQDALEESENRYRQLFDSANDAIIIMDNDGILDCNSSTQKLFEYNRDEIISKNIVNFSSDAKEEKNSDINKGIEKSFAGENQFFEWIFRKKNGGNFFAEVNISPVSLQSGIVLMVLIRDITERKKAEEEYRRLATVVEQSAEIIVITDREANIIYVNPSFEKITGYTREEVEGKNPRILQSGEHGAEFYSELWGTITRGNTWHGSLVNKTKQGNLYNEKATISPVRDSSGTITHYVGIKRDVTQELKLETQLRQAQKMESIGTLAGGIAHDFNNILSAIIGYTQLSIKHPEKRETLDKNLNNVLTASKRAKDLVAQILTFSRKAEREKQSVLVAPIIKEIVKFMRASLPSTIGIIQTLEAERDAIMADPIQIHQVMMNLCTNAGHAMKEHGGTMEVSVVNFTNPVARIYPLLPPGEYVKISVSDTGHGIPQKILEKIFEPYFTTKEKGEGTGMGLAVVHGIIRDHGGDISVYSEEGKGTVFHVLLPLDETKHDIKKQEENGEIPRGNEHIFVVDDEKELVDITRQMLNDLGYQTSGETSATDALEKLEKNRNAFDLIITDKEMPKIDGFDFAREVREFSKDIPIIMCTGFQEPSDREKADELNIKKIITKPIPYEVLARSIRKLLDKKNRK